MKTKSYEQGRKDAIEEFSEKFKQIIKETNWQYYWYGVKQEKNEIINEEINKRIDKIKKEMQCQEI